MKIAYIYSSCETFELEVHDCGTYTALAEGGFNRKRNMGDPCIELRINGYYFVPEEGIAFPIDLETAEDLKAHFVERSGI